MTLSRRGFLFSLTAAGWTLARGGVAPKGEPKLRFGLLSDSHVSRDQKTHEAIRRIFKFLATKNVDAVCHAGDIVEVGDFTELKVVADAWKDAFPDGRNSGGNKVIPFFVFGNHDYHDGSKYRRQKLSPEQQLDYILWDKSRAWQMLTGEATFPGEVYSREIKGFTFIGAHWKHEEEIAEFVAKHPVDPSKPVFHVRHPHPMGTCYGAWASGVEKGCETFRKMPNLWVMSGHSHLNIANDRAIWQGGYVSMGSGSSYGTAVGGFGGVYDNTAVKAPAEGQYWHSPKVSGSSWQTSVISVYDDLVYVERFDLKHDIAGETLGEPWAVDFPFRHDRVHPYIVADEARPPRFGEGAKISFRKATGKRRPDRVKEAQLIVEVSESAKSDGDHSRPAFYRFEILDEKNEVRFVREMVQENWPSCEKRSSAEKVVCHIALDELPEGLASFKVRVTPQNASAKNGSPILSEEFKL